MRAVHGHPGVTRAQVAAEIGIPSGFAAETVARLVAARLVSERPAPSTGRRGRPTTSLCAHPDGPLVAAVAITHDTWQIAAVQLGGTKVAATVRPHHRNQGRVLNAVAAELDRVNRRFGACVRAAAVAVPGTVVGSKLVHAPGLGWHGIDLSAMWPSYEPGRSSLRATTRPSPASPSHATVRALARALWCICTSTPASAARSSKAGRAIRGTTGAAGEFGHMPFGDPARRCRCGARGCWNTSLDGRALARPLHQRVPANDVGYLRRVLASARAGQPGALSAIQAVASSIGRGVAGLVNGLDPHLVVVGGFGPELLHIAADEVTAAYHDGLTAFRAIPPPPIVPARLGPDAPLLGAADEAFALLLTDESCTAPSAAAR